MDKMDGGGCQASCLTYLAVAGGLGNKGMWGLMGDDEVNYIVIFGVE